MLTGTIFAAILVILLVSVCRESYVVAGSGAAAETPAAALFFNQLNVGGVSERSCNPGRDGDSNRFSAIAYRHCVLK